MKKMLAVNGSPRKNGANAQIIEKAAELASKYDYETEIINVYDLGLGGCKSCMACKKTGKCIQKDQMNEILDKIKESDMLLFATPVYFSSETGPLKTFLDRMYPLVTENEKGLSADLGKVNKFSVVVTCNSPDGLLYSSIMTRYINTMKSFGISDSSGSVIPGVGMTDFINSDYVEGYLNSIEFQLEM